mmetsp:Transcript_34591/g.99638  ORF Transcript_34591/g.99638 Transcript_34591/m.99638 type:complete len:237 (-) Transcript_34591:598-1308(-)
MGRAAHRARRGHPLAGRPAHRLRGRGPRAHRAVDRRPAPGEAGRRETPRSVADLGEHVGPGLGHRRLDPSARPRHLILKGAKERVRGLGPVVHSAPARDRRALAVRCGERGCEPRGRTARLHLPPVGSQGLLAAGAWLDVPRRPQLSGVLKLHLVVAPRAAVVAEQPDAGRSAAEARLRVRPAEVLEPRPKSLAAPGISGAESAPRRLRDLRHRADDGWRGAGRPRRWRHRQLVAG